MNLPPKVCPECREEYLHQTEMCVHCDVPLVLESEVGAAPTPPEFPPASELELLRGASMGWSTGLSERLSKLTADSLDEVIEQIADNRVSWVPQDGTRATFAPKIRRSDGQLIWTENAQALCRRVRAMAPSPGAFTTFEGESLQILDARSDESLADVAPGTVRMGPARELRIATGDGWVLPRILQRPGRRALGVEVFIRGRPIPDGTLLG